MSKIEIPQRVSAETRIIGRNLSQLRKLNGYSQRQIAQALGTSFQQVQKYEKGQNRVSAEKLHALKLFFDVPYERFFEGFDTKGHDGTPSVTDLLEKLCLKVEGIKDTARQKQLCRAFLTLVSYSVVDKANKAPP